jgi:hypothetical protein
MKSFFLIIALITTSLAFAQKNSTSNSIAGQTSFYAELGGPGILFSANIDRRFTKSKFGFGARFGLGFVNIEDRVYSYPYYDYRRKSILTVPMQLNYVFGKPSSVHSFEVGLGVTFTGRKVDLFSDYYYRDNNLTNLFGTASFMYRRMPKDGGFSWRIGFTPLLSNGFIQTSAGVSVGYNF